MAWRNPIRLQNRVVPGYWLVDMDVLRSTVAGDLGGFVGQLRDVLDRITQDGVDV